MTPLSSCSGGKFTMSHVGGDFTIFASLPRIRAAFLFLDVYFERT